MKLKEYISKFKKDYVINKVKRTNIPSFDHSDTVREELAFSGKVQKVGFRLEFYELAKRLELKGWVKNLENGNVQAQVQGQKNKIDFLIKNMKPLKRARVDNLASIEIEELPDEEGFTIER